MSKKTQSGFVDLQVLMIVLVIILSGSFLMFRLSTADDHQGNSVTQQSSDGATDFESSLIVEEVEATENDQQDESTDTNTVVTTPQNSFNENLVTFVKGGISPLIAGKTVSVSSTMSGAFSGTCTYTFKLGNTSVSETNQIHNSATCETDVDVSLFPKNGLYDVSINFTSNDGQTTADIDGLSVNITPVEFSFTKGGGDYDGTNVFVSQTSAAPHTGTCTYRFTNGNSKVETSTTIDNSKTCETTVPGTSFPKSGNWLFELDFVASDALIVGSGGGFTIEIN